MSADQDELAPKPGARPRLSETDRSALSWLARWFGIPFLMLIGLYYAEPLFRGNRVDIVETVTRQEVRRYPFPEGSGSGTSLAPPAIPRAPRAPIDIAPPPIIADVPPTSADIVAHPVAQPQPIYPRRALEAEKEGTVRLRITIAPDGSVIEAVVVTSRPSGWFESAAVNGVKRWRYLPSERTISTEVEIEFKLN